MAKQFTMATTRVLAAARKALCYVVDHVNTGGRAGGYFGLFPKGQSATVASPAIFKPIGRIRPEKRNRYRRLAQEKSQRLNVHPDHVSSYQSRNEKRDRWGGAINTKTHYLSFSGLPELCDEALVLMVARRLGMLTDKQARRIAGISGNGLFVSWANAQRA